MSQELSWFFFVCDYNYKTTHVNVVPYLELLLWSATHFIPFWKNKQLQITMKSLRNNERQIYTWFMTDTLWISLDITMITMLVLGSVSHNTSTFSLAELFSLAEWWRSYYYLSKQLLGCLDRASLRSGPHRATSSLIMTFLGLAPDRRFEQMHCGKEVPSLPTHCYCWADREKGQLIKIIERDYNGLLSHLLRMLFAVSPTHANSERFFDGHLSTMTLICISG